MEDRKIVEEILERIKEKGIKVDFYKISFDDETEERTLIVKTSSFKSLDEDIEKLNEIERDIQEWIDRNLKMERWYIILIPLEG